MKSLLLGMVDEDAVGNYVTGVLIYPDRIKDVHALVKEYRAWYLGLLPKVVPIDSEETYQDFFAKNQKRYDQYHVMQGRTFGICLADWMRRNKGYGSTQFYEISATTEPQLHSGDYDMWASEEAD
jgi:hypothetical protein